MNITKDTPDLNTLVTSLFTEADAEADPLNYSAPISLPLVFIKDNPRLIPILCQPSLRTFPKTCSLRNLEYGVTDFLPPNWEILGQRHSSKIRKISLSKIKNEKLRTHTCVQKRVLPDQSGQTQIYEVKVTKTSYHQPASVRTNFRNTEEADTKSIDSYKSSLKSERGSAEEIVRGYKHLITYEQTKFQKRTRKIIHWEYENWTKKFQKSWNFINHARMHLGIKPHQCDKWGRRFTQRGNLRKHILRHSLKAES